MENLLSFHCLFVCFSVIATFSQTIKRLFCRLGKTNVTARSLCFYVMQMFHLSIQDGTDGWLVGLFIVTTYRHFYLQSNVALTKLCALTLDLLLHDCGRLQFSGQ